MSPRVMWNRCVCVQWQLHPQAASFISMKTSRPFLPLLMGEERITAPWVITHSSTCSEPVRELHFIWRPRRLFIGETGRQMIEHFNLLWTGTREIIKSEAAFVVFKGAVLCVLHGVNLRTPNQELCEGVCVARGEKDFNYKVIKHYRCVEQVRRGSGIMRYNYTIIDFKDVIRLPGGHMFPLTRSSSDSVALSRQPIWHTRLL